MDALKAKVVQTFDGFVPQSLVVCFWGIIAHLDTCATIIAILVLSFKLKEAFYSARIKQLDYAEKKECFEANHEKE